jgi:transcriptional regulator with XRE-family HTH domain
MTIQPKTTLKTMNAVTEILQKFQNQQNLTQHQMANFLQISQATYNNCVNSRTPIDPKYYPTIANICQIDVASLIPASATINISNGSSNENKMTVNALELYEEFNKHLKEVNQLQKVEIERLQKRVAELEVFTVK